MTCTAQMQRIHASHDASGYATDGRTYERNVDITHLTSKSLVSVRARQKANQRYGATR